MLGVQAPTMNKNDFESPVDSKKVVCKNNVNGRSGMQGIARVNFTRVHWPMW